MLSKDLGLHSSFQLFEVPGPVRDADTEKNEISVLTVSRQMQWWCDGSVSVGRVAGQGEALTRSTQSTKALSLLTISDMRAGEAEEVLSTACGTPGSLLTPAHGDAAAYITTSTAASLVQALNFARTLAIAVLPVSHSFLAQYKSIPRKRQCTQQNKVMRVIQGSVRRG